MFRRISNSWELAKASASVLKSDRKLLVFPLISSVAAMIVCVSFWVPFYSFLISNHLSHQQTDRVFHSPLAYGLTFSFYLVEYFVIFFMNTALVSAAIARLNGESPTVADSLRLAARRADAILGYAFIAATVGMVLRVIAERTGVIGRVVTGLLGMAWTAATYLVAPVLAAERVGPIGAIRRSAGLLKQTWGEQIVGNAGIDTVFGLFILAVMVIVGAPAMWLFAAGLWAAGIALLVLLLIAVLLSALVAAALAGIYSAAVYKYASGGFVGGPFSEDQMRAAFRPKRRRR